MLVFGTRPEAIKMAPLVLALQAAPERFRPVVCVTGQHREMLDGVLRFFGIRPDYDLNIMKDGQTLEDVTTRVLLGMREVLEQERPDIVLVHGDTTTSMAAALAAFYRQIPVGHVEAGLRTYNIYSPWPEEMNRQITARISAWHFAPTEQSRSHLLSEGISPDKIFVTGNTVIDALQLAVQRVGTVPSETGAGRMVLITGHRRENFGKGFSHAFHAIKVLLQKYPDVTFVYPVHPNPNVRQTLHAVFGDAAHYPNLRLMPPPDYPDFVRLMASCTLVLTDSGGIQEEAPSLGKPVLVMRDTSERPEAIAAGTARLVGTDSERIISEVSVLLDNPEAYRRMSRAVNPYGDGKASQRIVQAILHDFAGEGTLPDDFSQA